MKSRAVRLTLLLLLVIAVGVTAYLFLMGESRARVEMDAVRTYEDRAVAAARDLYDLRAAQQAYVAAGQGEQFWIQKVTGAVAGIRDALAQLRAGATSLQAQTAVDAASVALKDFEQMDRRAAEYARTGQKLLASDIIFADGVELTTSAAAAVDEARSAEIRAREAGLTAIRDRQLFAAGAAAAAALLVAFLLVPQAPQDPQSVESTESETAAVADAPLDSTDGLDYGPALDEGWSVVKREPIEVPPAVVPEPAVVPARAGVDMTSVASLCTDLARLDDTRSLPSLLERAATALDASGIVLWIADPDGRDLSPILTHGYAPQVVSRLGTIVRDGENATAAAFRTGLVQTVKTDAASNGAIAAPLVTADGCVGVMAAEVRNEGEQDPAKLAAAAIVAAQLATLVGPPASRAKAEAAG